MQATKTIEKRNTNPSIQVNRRGNDATPQSYVSSFDLTKNQIVSSDFFGLI